MISSELLNLSFAPMATLSHGAFRRLIDDWGGCRWYFTEMIDAAGHLSDGGWERFYADSSPCPEKVIFQIVGSDADQIVAAAESLSRLECHGIDINMGCSAPAIVRLGAGIAWMANADAAARLTERLRRVVGTKSLSMKFRLGEKEELDSLVNFCRGLERAGADFLTLHPRIRKDSLSRPARWQWIAPVREAVKIPVWGNGDLDSWSVLQKRIRHTPADGWMIGRRAAVAPWSFHYWNGLAQNADFDFSVDLVRVSERFHELLETYQPKAFWVSRSRRFYLYFFQNFLWGHRWGAAIQRLRDYGEIRTELQKFWDTTDEPVVRKASEWEKRATKSDASV